MDFKSPPGVIERAAAEADFGNFGYAKCPAGLVEVIIERCKDLYGWEIESSWIVWLPGMVCALNVSCRVFEKESSQVFTQTPVYPPFLSAPGNFDLPCTRIPMVLDQGRFGIDFDALDALPSNPPIFLCFAIRTTPLAALLPKRSLPSSRNGPAGRIFTFAQTKFIAIYYLNPGLSIRLWLRLGRKWRIVRLP